MGYTSNKRMAVAVVKMRHNHRGEAPKSANGGKQPEVESPETSQGIVPETGQGKVPETSQGGSPETSQGRSPETSQGGDQRREQHQGVPETSQGGVPETSQGGFSHPIQVLHSGERTCIRFWARASREGMNERPIPGV
ncbi:hypothetical protein ACHAWF_004880 [Thalassiosira exigua]